MNLIMFIKNSFTAAVKIMSAQIKIVTGKVYV